VSAEVELRHPLASVSVFFVLSDLSSVDLVSTRDLGALRPRACSMNIALARENQKSANSLNWTAGPRAGSVLALTFYLLMSFFSSSFCFPAADVDLSLSCMTASLLRG